MAREFSSRSQPTGSTALILLAAMITFGISSGDANSQQQQQQQQTTEDSSPEEGADEDSETERIRKLIESLGATSFRVREAATAELLTVGPKALPMLRQLKDAGDPEMRQRIGILTDRLVNDDFERRATAFIEGDDNATLPGWQYAGKKLGNSLIHREIFVELSRRHPGVTIMLDGDAKERTEALDLLTADVGPPIMDPNAVDAIALILLRSDSEVVAKPISDGLIFSLLNRYEVNDVLKDPEVNKSVRTMLEQWTKQVSVEYQYNAINVALQWQLESTAELTRKILETSDNVVVLQAAMRVLAKNGTADDAIALKPFLGDKRQDPNGFFYTDAAGRRLEVQLRDVAMATIALLHGRELRDFGFPAAKTHPTLAFDVDSLGFPIGKDGEEARGRVRQDIDELLDES